MEFEPKVTAGVLCYNEEKYLKECIKSLNGQTYKNLEIVISDNNSYDNSKKLLLKIKKKYPKIKFNFFKKNVGVIKNIQKTIDMSSADYFFIISPGDKIDKNFVKECMQIHIKKKVACVMCNTHLVYKEKKTRVIDFKYVNNFNNLSAFKQSKFIRTYNAKIIEMKFNFFILGIFKKSILKNIHKSFIKNGISPDDERIILYCACMSAKLYHLNKFLYTKFSYRKTPREEMFFHELEDANSIIYNLKSIFAIINIPNIRKIKFSVIIINILFFKIRKILFNFLLIVRARTKNLLKLD